MQNDVDIKFACSECDQHLIIASSGAGQPASCPFCGHEILVPHLGALDCRDYAPLSLLATAADNPRGAFVESQGLASGRVRGRESAVDLGVGLETEPDYLASAALPYTQEDHACLQHAHRELQERYGYLEAAFAHTQAEIRHLQTDRSTLTNDLSISRQRAAATELQLSTREKQLQELRRELEATKQDAKKLEAEVTSLAHRRAAFEKELESTTEALSIARRSESLLQKELARATKKLRQRGQELEKRKSACEELHLEAECLRKDLAATTGGEELMHLRAEVKQLHAEARRLSRTSDQYKEHTERLSISEERVRAELQAVRRLHSEAVKRAESLSESNLEQGNVVLRGILARQKTELEQCYVELTRLRRKDLALRITYGIFGIGALAVLAFAVVVLGSFLG